MPLFAIVASTPDGVIGSNNTLPWRLKEDLQYFRTMTLHKTVVMGRKTFESIGRPLDHRINLILSHTLQESPPGTQLIQIKDVLQRAHSEEIWVIGGAQVYQQLYHFLDAIYLTRVFSNIAGDAYFTLPSAPAFRCTQCAPQTSSSGVTMHFEVWHKET